MDNSADIYKLTAVNIEGGNIPLRLFRGKVLLIVNTGRKSP